MQVFPPIYTPKPITKTSLCTGKRLETMASGCISNCISDARVPIRATYTNLYKWPESDAEFARSVSSNSSHTNNPRVVDSISCRQLYLRSYTFSRKECVPEKTKKCFGKVKERMAHGRRKTTSSHSRGRACLVVGKVKEMSCAALFTFFNRLLSCNASVDVVGL